MNGQLVVIVDDRITNLKILERLAGSLGDDVATKTFTDPLAACAACAIEPPAVAIVDCSQPGLGGAELIRRLQSPPTADTAVVAVIAAEDREARLRALDAGAADYLASPVDHREFRARIGTLLALRRLPAVVDRTPQEGVRQAHERLLRVIDAIPMPICATGSDGRYVLVNRQFAEFVGVAPAGLIGRSPEEARDDAFAQALTGHDRRLRAGEVPATAFEDEVVDRHGESRVLLTSKSVFRDAGTDAAMIVTVALDITERKAAERDLLAAKDQAEIANRSKTEFLANMSHELRTPLNAIIGFSQVMAGEMLGPIVTRKYVGYAGDIIASAEHLLGIINDILDVSKLEAGKLDLVEEVVDLRRAVADVLHLVEAKARAGEISIAVDATRDLPRLRGDSRKIKQILLNLLTNAVKFSRRGGTVEIALRYDSGAISCSVGDHGIGMDAREAELAVTRFGQVASAWSRRHAGTGLGLPLAIGLAELHGATLTLRTSKGVGTTATLAFPPERSQVLEPVAEGGIARAAHRA